jgi:Raf kinase inhibitor-like YbhB/YbcL family protein
LETREQEKTTEQEGSMKVTSSAFRHGERIPQQYSRNDSDKSPPLHIEGVPPGARSLAVIVDDPDAQRAPFTHWVMFNIDPKVVDINEDSVPESAKQGANDWGETEYGGPQPPSGEHRYLFNVFALNSKLDLPAGAKRSDLEREMSNRILDKAVLEGRYAAAA